MKHSRSTDKRLVRFFCALIVALPAAWLIAAVTHLFGRLLNTPVDLNLSLPGYLASFVVVLLLALLALELQHVASNRRAGRPSAAAASKASPSRHEQDDRDEDDDEDEDDSEYDLANAEEGDVKWFSRDRGYGFVVRGNGEEVFVHFRAIRGRGRRKFLQEGQRVRFNIVDGENGKPKAVNVFLLDEL